jgi:hypothetical protein
VLSILGASLVVSLAAQVAEAELSVWGWTLAAVPSLGAFALAKIVLTRPGASETATATKTVPATTETSTKPKTKPKTKTKPETKPEPRRAPGTETETGRAGGRDRGREDEGDLVAAARDVAGELAAAGARVTRDRLVSGLRARGHRCGTKRAGELLELLRTPHLVAA